MPEQTFDFATALNHLRDGLKVSRQGWNGKNQFIKMQFPDDSSWMTLPYFYMTTVSGDRVPWLATHTDLLAGDWYLIAK